MTTATNRSFPVTSLPLWILFVGVMALSNADIKVGSYVWMHKYDASVEQQLYPGIPTTNAYGGGYSHLDISWVWTLEQGMAMVNNDWTTAASCLDDNPTWYGGHSGMQSANYMLKKMYPSTWARIKAHSDAGRWDGSELSWAEGYWDFGGDEYYLRNYYVSYHFCKDNFGYAPLAASSWDLDAPCWTQPKVQTYITGRSAENPTGVGFTNRGYWNNNDVWAPNSWDQYRWTSDDGSMTLVGHQGIYSGDGGGAEICAPSAGRFPTFASKVYKENNWNTSVPNLWNDHTIHYGGSGFSLIWWGAKICENRLLEAEKFATFARPYGYVYPLTGDDYLYEIWGGFLRFNQHDLADAQQTPAVTLASNSTNMNLMDYYLKALRLADSTLGTALKAISANVNTSGAGTSVIVYNALSWPRTDYVMVKTSYLGISAPFTVRDPAGAAVPSQVITDSGVTKLVFVAENVPSLGFREFKVSSATSSAAAGVTAVNGGVIQLDNQYCTVKIDKTSGAIASLYDKVNSKELLGAPGNQIASNTAAASNMHWWENCCGTWGHYPPEMPGALSYLTPSSVTLVDSGPAVARVKISYTDAWSVKWDLYVSLFNEVPVVCNKMVTSNLDGTELIVNLPLNASVSNAGKEHTAGVAYGHHKYVGANASRYVNANAGFDWQVMTPATQKWANVANDAKDYGVALLENNCSIWSFYGIGGAHDLRMVLVANYWAANKLKNWEMSWGIWGHTGDWNGGVPQRGYEFNSPLIARVEGSHAGQLPKEYSFLSVEPKNIVVTVVKKWEDESPTQKDSLTAQVRFYEVEGENTDAVLTFPGFPSIKAWESMGNEYGVYGGQLLVAAAGGTQSVTFTTGHNQIRSLKVQTPYAATAIRPSDPFAPLRVVRTGAETAVRVYNTKGQLIWHGPNLATLAASKARQSAPGLYLARYQTKDGAVVATRKLCGEGGAFHH